MTINARQLMEAAWTNDFTYEEAVSYGADNNITFTREEYCAVCTQMDNEMEKSFMRAF